MDAFRQWVLCVIIAAAAGTFACIVSPKGSLDKTVRAVVGIFVVASICAPLMQLKKIDSADYELASYNYDSDITDELTEYTLSACRSAVENEVLTLADRFGISIKDIFIDAYVDKDECIIIQDIQVEIYSSCESETESFSAELKNNLGLSVTVNAE